MSARSSLAVVAATLAIGVPAAGVAQEISLQSGGSARISYTDNYFFTPGGREGASTLTLSPFVTAARRTETSSLAALLTVGANKVWGLHSDEEFVSGRLDFDGSVRLERSAWSGAAYFARIPSLQSGVTPDGVTLGLAYTNAAGANGLYGYTIDDQWRIEASIGGYANHYDRVEGSQSTFEGNYGYQGGFKALYDYSRATKVAVSLNYSRFKSDIERDDSVASVLSVAHDFSPQLWVSAAVGYFVTEIGTPGQPRRREDGALLGGNLGYTPVEGTKLEVSLSEQLVPSANGSLARNDNFIAWVSHKFSDRLAGRIGASYARNDYLTSIGNAFTNTYVVGEVGASYRLAERWTLEGGYRYTRARYSEDASTARSNAVSLSISYNWPGVSSTDWVGARSMTPNMPGAVPLVSPGQSLPLPGERPGSTVIEDLFEPLYIP